MNGGKKLPSLINHSLLGGGDNMLIGFVKEKQEEAFDDWIKLLKAAKAEEEFLTEPKAVWLEAWTQATMVAWGIVNDNVPPEYREKVFDKMKIKFLK